LRPQRGARREEKASGEARLRFEASERKFEISDLKFEI
jgi:hypothetical protein